MQGFTWRIGGPQGGGVDRAAQVFARAWARSGRFAALRREYHSNIMGRHSYADVRVAPRARPGFFARVDALSAMDGETLVRHLGALRPGGLLLYDPEAAKGRVSDLRFLDPPARARAARALGAADPSLADVLGAHEAAGAELLPVPVGELLAEAGVGRRALGMLLSAVAARVLGLAIEPFLEALEGAFAGRPRVVEENRRLVELAFARFAPRREAPPAEEEGERIWVSGSMASAMGKVAAGLGFMSYYPITPATDEPFYLEASPESGVTVVQVEDELAAVNMAIGAALAGTPAALTTSGPGFSLMPEALSFAGMVEAPLVVTLYQRGGPSTGLPTRHEQGDLLFALFAGHGEFPKVVLASGSVEEMFEDAALALRLAWRYQLPVIHLADKHLAQEQRALPPFDPELPPAEPRSAEPAPAFPRFRLGAEDGVSPFLPVGAPGGQYWITSDEHDEHGHITEDPELRVAMMEKRMRKLEALAAEISPEEMYAYHRPEAPAVVVGFGSVKGAALEALEAVPGVGYLHLRFLSPFPDLGRVLMGKRVAVLEQNATGQLARLLAMEAGVRPETRILKYNGRPMTIEEVAEAFRAFAGGEAGPRVVLTEGV